MEHQVSSSRETRVEHVSDTSLMTAAGRAIETARADGVIRDPLAEHLAGPRGAALAQTLYSPAWMGITVGLRSRVIDEMLTEAIAVHGIQVVMILGAGLDTRPYRLALPQALRWIEVDLPGILDYKSQLLAFEKPKCRLERIAADLTDATARQAVFAAAGSHPGLILTEGLLLYLPASATEALATEPVRLSGIRYWLLDVAASILMRNAHRDHFDDVEKVRAKDRVQGQQIVDLVNRNGWRLIRRRTYTAEAFRIAASRGLEALPDSAAPPADDPSGIYLFSQ